jgi:hypothetical protein
MYGDGRLCSEGSIFGSRCAYIEVDAKFADPRDGRNVTKSGFRQDSVLILAWMSRLKTLEEA